MNRILYWTIAVIISIIFAFIFQFALSTPDFTSYVLGLLLAISIDILNVIDEVIKYREEK